MDDMDLNELDMDLFAVLDYAERAADLDMDLFAVLDYAERVADLDAEAYGEDM